MFLCIISISSQVSTGLSFSWHERSMNCLCTCFMYVQIPEQVLVFAVKFILGFSFSHFWLSLEERVAEKRCGDPQDCLPCGGQKWPDQVSWYIKTQFFDSLFTWVLNVMNRNRSKSHFKTCCGQDWRAPFPSGVKGKLQTMATTPLSSCFPILGLHYMELK